MAGLADTDMIDLVAQDATGRVLLVIVEAGSWRSTSSRQRQLREKINAYAEFILGGRLVREHPEAAGRPVIIQLWCENAPYGAMAELIRFATRKLGELGIAFRVEIAA
jgi:hypothetical protein